MKHFRKDRMASLIRELLSKMILRDVEVPGALITITEVEVSDRLERAVANVSVIPSEKSTEVLESLSSKAGGFQHALIREMNVRPVPRISFEIDPGPEKAARIEKLLIDSDLGDSDSE